MAKYFKLTVSSMSMHSLLIKTPDDINEQFEEHCADRAKELAEINNLNPDYY